MKVSRNSLKIYAITLVMTVLSVNTFAQTGNLNNGNKLGLAWRERQKTYSLVGQSGRLGLLNSTSLGNPLAGPISLDPQPDTENGEVALEFQPGRTESPVTVPSVARMVGETQFSPAMAKAYVDSLNAELTAAGATIAAIEPMLAQHANISTSIGISMANAQMNAESALDAQLAANKQNGENVRNIYRGCLSKRLLDHDNYLQAVEYCRGGTAKPLDADKFSAFGAASDRMMPLDSPDHPGRGFAADNEIFLSNLIFKQYVKTTRPEYARSAEHLHQGFKGLFGDVRYDYQHSDFYNGFGTYAAKGTIVSPVRSFVEPTLTIYDLKLPNGDDIAPRDYYVSLQGMSKFMKGLPLYDRYRGEYTYATLVVVTRGYCEYFRNHVGDNTLDKTDHNDDEDRFWRLMASGKTWNAGSFAWPGTWFPAEENALGVLSVGDFAFSAELGQWMVSTFFRERKIDPANIGASGGNPCEELNPYRADTSYMELKRRMRAKESTGSTGPVPVYLRRMIEYADLVSRMQSLLILSDTWNDVLKTIGDTQYMGDASKLIDLSAGSLDVESIGTDKVELQHSLTFLLDRLRQDYQNSVGTGSSIHLSEKKTNGNSLGS